jgi:hypothetical protein
MPLYILTYTEKSDPLAQLTKTENVPGLLPVGVDAIVVRYRILYSFLKIINKQRNSKAEERNNYTKQGSSPRTKR